MFYLSQKWIHANNNNSNRCSTVLLATKTKASPGIISDTAQDAKYLLPHPPRVSFSKYDQIRRQSQICSHLPKKSLGITSLLTQCGSNNTQYKELLSLIFLPHIQKYIISFSIQRSEAYTWVFKAINIWYVFLFLIWKSIPEPWTARRNGKFCLVLQNITFCEVTLTKSSTIPMRYFLEIVSKSCWRSISFYFKHKSQYLINFKFANNKNFHFFHFFYCIFCSINYSNSLSLFAFEFFQFFLSGASLGDIPIV